MIQVPRIVTVSLNAAIDRTVHIPGFAAGAVNRVSCERSHAGGKGVNVAAYLADFGHPVTVTGLLGAANTELFARLFAGKGLIDRFVRVPGETRVNIKVVDDVHHLVTDINFPGFGVRPDDLDAVLAVLEDLARKGARWFVLSGSLPGGLPPTTWRDVVALLKAHGCRVVLDTSGAALAEAIAAGPDVVKPNLDELTALVGSPIADEGAAVDAARALQRTGIGLVVVSMGGRGAIFVDGACAVVARPPAVAVRSTVGAGDAMVAGIVHALLQHASIEECACLATAFAVGALGTIGPQLPPRAEIEALRCRVGTQTILL